MLTTASIALSLQDTPATNGWDAVFAMNLKQVNALFFHQYLEHGPPKAAKHLRAMFDTKTARQYAILDFKLGPPELCFRAGSDAKLEMELIEGVLATFHPGERVIQNAVWIRPKESKLTGSLALAKVKGEVLDLTLAKVTAEANRVGQVVLDLGASAYTPTIAGVDPKSKLNTQIGEAAQTFFATSATTFLLGTIAPGDVPVALTPTTFQFTTQSSPQDTCVLLLIQTNGQAGTVGPLPSYPIPDGHTAALLIAERPLFDGAIVDTLTKVFKPSGGTFKGIPGQSGWSTAAQSGAISFGQIGNGQTWSDGAIQFPLKDFTIKRAQGGLQADWTSVCSQNWRRMVTYSTPGNPHSGSPGHSHEAPSDPSNLTLSITFTWHGTPSVDATTGVVSFATKDKSCQLNPESKTSAYHFWGMYSIEIDDGITKQITSNLEKNLDQACQLVSVNTFALQSLLFPSAHAVSLKEAGLPRDLILTGSLEQPVVVAPADVMLTPGASMQFSVAGRQGGDFLWEIKPPSVGSISAAGLYTAPSTLKSAEIVVVSAVNKANAGSVGKAMVLVYNNPAAQGVAVSPAKSLVTAGRSVELWTTDKAGKLIEVTWKLSPDLGTIQRLEPGYYVYNGPKTISGGTRVTATAVDATTNSLTGTAVIQVAPFVGITIEPARPAMKLGASVALTATVIGGQKENIRWVVYPSFGAGTVTYDPDGDPSKATYTAPSSIPTSGKNPYVVAYLVNEDGAGVDSAAIELIS